MKKLLLGMGLLVIALLIGLPKFPATVSAVGQETCPNTGGGWIKVDGLSSPSYTYTVPSGKKVVEWCWKASTTVEYGTLGTPSTTTVTINSTETNQNGKIQDLSHASFKLEDVEETESEYPSMSASASCGNIELIFNNPTRFTFWFDYRVDSETGEDDFWTTYNGAGLIPGGPYAGQPFGQIYNLTEVLGGTTVDKDLSFAEDSGNHTVEYRLWRGPENDWYLPWAEISTNSDCEPNEDPTPTPTPTPEPTPTPSSTPDKEHSSLYVQQLNCYENDFRAQLDLFSGDHPQRDVLVTFTYNGLSQNTYTNKDGRAIVDLTFAGEGVVKATPNNGYSSQEAKVTKETNCSAVGGPVVSGQVLGANTYAETGILEDIMMSVVGLSGATMTAVGAKLHAKKKN